MAIDASLIETFLDSEELHYFKRECGEAIKGSWTLFFEDKAGAVIHLIEDGECVMFRSLPILHIDEFDRKSQLRIFEAMAHRNDQLIIGRFCGTSTVYYEASLVIEDGEITGRQFHRILASVVSESNDFGVKLRRIGIDPSADTKPDPIDELMNQLIEGEEDANES